MKFLNALKGCNFDTPPIWIMRQAGRYLPEYRELRARHSLRELFFTPKLAAQVTLQPIARFGFDAAILFSDITAIAPAMGYNLEFNEGPSVTPASLKLDLSALDPIAEAAFLTKQQLTVPLIGFCGGPYTISKYFPGPVDFDLLTEVCIASLKRQIEAGADAVQIFDSWAHQLSDEEFEEYSLKPLKKIIQQINVPVILFMRGSARRAEKLAALQPAAISLDWDRPIQEIRRSVKIALQGNLDPDLLFAPLEQIRKETRALLDVMHRDPAFIVNLGHGIKPGTPLEAVAALVAEIKTSKEEKILASLG